MVKGSILQSAALTAIIAAISVSVPVQAQDIDRSGARAERQQMRQEARQSRQEARQQAPQQAQQAPRQEYRQQRQAAQAPERQAQRAARQEWRQQRAAQAPQQQVQAPISRVDRRAERNSAEGTRGRSWNRMENRPDARQADGQIQQRTWRGRDGSITAQGERNRTYADRDRNGTYRSGYRDGRTADRYRDNRDQRHAYRSGYRDGDRSDLRRDNWRGGHDRRWDNNWRRDNRYNWYSYRNQNRNIYRVGRYYSPYRNYNYSRLSIGLFLNSGFYGNNYWVNDPWQYRLPEVYGPYKWVRYYDDVILVDIYTGEVVDVIHDFFW